MSPRGIPSAELSGNQSPVLLIVSLPMPPNIANARMHWRTKNTARKAYFAACDNWQLVKKVPTPPRVPFSGVVLTSTMVLGRRMDQDNAVARHKWALDWLVTRGYLAGDSERHVRWMAMPEQNVWRQFEPMLTLTFSQPSHA